MRRAPTGPLPVLAVVAALAPTRAPLSPRIPEDWCNNMTNFANFLNCPEPDANSDKSINKQPVYVVASSGKFLVSGKLFSLPIMRSAFYLPRTHSARTHSARTHRARTAFAGSNKRRQGASSVCSTSTTFRKKMTSANE